MAVIPQKLLLINHLCELKIDKARRAIVHIRPQPTVVTVTLLPSTFVLIEQLKKTIYSVVTWSVLIGRMISRAVKQTGNDPFCGFRQMLDFSKTSLVILLYFK